MKKLVLFITILIIYCQNLFCQTQYHIAYKRMLELEYAIFDGTHQSFVDITDHFSLDTTFHNIWNPPNTIIIQNGFGIASAGHIFFRQGDLDEGWRDSTYFFANTWNNEIDLYQPYKRNDNNYVVASGTTGQYIKGDGSKATFPTIPTNTNQLTNGAGFISVEVDGSITNEIQNLSYSAGSLSISGGNSVSIPTGSVSSIGISSSDFFISSSPITSSGTIVANLNTSGITAGSYASSTFNSKGIATGGLNWTIPSSTGARSFNTAYRESSTNVYNISLSPQISCSLSLAGGQSGTISLEISANGTSGWVPVGLIAGSNTGSLTIGLNTTQITGGQLTYDVPATYYYRLTTSNIIGTPSYTFNGGSYKILQ